MAVGIAGASFVAGSHIAPAVADDTIEKISPTTIAVTSIVQKVTNLSIGQLVNQYDTIQNSCTTRLTAIKANIQAASDLGISNASSTAILNE